MARIAFVMDKPLRRIGLSGREVIVPMLVGFGCTVPGRDGHAHPALRARPQMTILLTPFMSCSAKLPIYAFFSAVFFPRCAMWVMAGLYLFGIVLGVLHATLLRKTLFSGEPVPFVMELPNYRMPGAKTSASSCGKNPRISSSAPSPSSLPQRSSSVPANVRSAPQRRRGIPATACWR